MEYAWLEKYLLDKKGVVKEFHEAFGVDRYLIGDKMFAMWGGDKTGQPIITLKLDPDHGDLLRNQYSDIKPGYYMNKLHWNSLYLAGAVPDDILRDMVDESYRINFASLTKKKQKEITCAT